jgi:hypothetical protein
MVRVIRDNYPRRHRVIATPCKDCGLDTTPCTGRRGCRHKGRWELYMVYDDVWDAARMCDGYLCIGCLERRLGRCLTPADFPPLPVNDPVDWDSDRLAARKGQR